jgi:hypothetical protein
MTAMLSAPSAVLRSRLAALPRGLQRAIMRRVNFSHVLRVVARRRRIGALAQVVAAAVLVGDAAELPAADIDPYISSPG